MNLKQMIKDRQLEPYMHKGSFGIEKEGLRTTSQGELAMTGHPEGFGDRSHHPYVQTDFSESQLELVTPPQESLNQQYQWLSALHDVVNRTIDSEEIVWPFSMPCILPAESDIPIIKVSNQGEIEYRKQLAAKYGKKKQMISGVHFNFSFSEAFIEAFIKDARQESEAIDRCNALYLKMSRNFLRNQWLLTYLFGASPVSHASYSSEGEGRYYRSIRNSPMGYHNAFSNRVSYQSVEGYVKDIETLVTEDVLTEEREYYGSARLRGKGKAVKNLMKYGTRYVEFRSFDLNPYERLGFSYEQSLLTHLFLLTMVWMDKDSSSEEIKRGEKMNRETALEDPFSLSAFKDEGAQLLNEMQKTLKDLNLPAAYQEAVDSAREQLLSPEKTLSARIVKDLGKEGSFIQLGLRLGMNYKEHAFEKPFLLTGFEDMEMSTQLLLSDALKSGLETTVLDVSDQFLKFEYMGKVEYVKNGNMTSHDSTISHWIMANKTVTKNILKRAGYQVPRGEEFASVESALSQYPLFNSRPVVVKPKTTNYGLGISIFRQPPTYSNYAEACRLAFEEDGSILVEDYIEGTEYRFVVIDDKVEAVLLREPANVIGDGSRTVAELIQEKNSHPYRGEKHRAPLEKIKMGEIEQLMLKEQGFQFDSVLEKGQRVFLRENSNISTGGDSTDMTDTMHESYKQAAVEMAQALGVKVTGLDLIIPDITQPSTEEKPGYVTIEANFNPAMHMHAFVQKGTGRNLTEKVIRMLYPSIK
ncbi:Glutathione biosynthesis bifunctional protein gshF [Alkalibacterium sp. AK22]|uniref:bifunctional glutamate--cysteine ligase GshA/glutathione synthetase GshB n=1 Tax=Alkalibacterium sp. AK22 TaxID=1229520 RepID=UPI00045179E3|nr:bifunctional glutamate--cysteine ligase GshA/glutathione synthetase GshB [Alkalibacterium sp. AK22]EXJ22814.1 Glutathione biosynthesis bifunctional protein gshF [Alkalibacterium sp. AK22]